MPPFGWAEVAPDMTLLFTPAELGAGLAGGHWGPPGQVVAVVEGADDHGVPAGDPRYMAQDTQEGQQPVAKKLTRNNKKINSTKLNHEFQI